MRRDTLGPAAALFFVYATLLIVNGLSYVLWNGDSSEMPRALPRVAIALVIAGGLRRRQLWAWFLGLLYAGGLGLVALIALPASLTYLETAGRPYPAFDVSFFVGSAAVLLAAFVYMLLPGTRREIWRQR